MWRWSGRLLLHSIFLQFASTLTLVVARLALRLATKSGALLPASLFSTHFLWSALLLGFGAGFIAFETGIAAVDWLNPIYTGKQIDPVWKQPQFWSWIPYLSVMAFGIAVFIAAGSGTVLSTTHASAAEVLDNFFTKPCLVPHTKDWSTMPDCGYQVFTTIFVAPAGYSLAAIPICMRFRAIQRRTQT